MSEKKHAVKNAADEKKVRDAEELEKLRLERERDDVRFLLAHPQGRRFMWRYLSECGVFRTSYHHSGSVVYYNEGQRRIGLMLLADVTKASPDAYLMMLDEAKKEGEIVNVG